MAGRTEQEEAELAFEWLLDAAENNTRFGCPAYNCAGTTAIECALPELLKRGINVNAKGGAALELAVRDKNKRLLRLLLAAPGIGVNASRTILQSAINSRDEEIIDMLLTAPGIDVNAHEGNGFTPLHAAVRIDDIGTFSKLIHKGADTTIKCTETTEELDQPFTALRFAQYLGNGAHIEAELREKSYSRSATILREQEDLHGAGRGSRF